MENSTPIIQKHINGISLPAEWSLQCCIMLTWPHNNLDWPREELAEVQECFTQMVKAIAPSQSVLIVAHNNTVSENILTNLQKNHIDCTNIEIRIIPNNDVWARDHGPITIYKNGQAQLLNFGFNGWGKRFSFDLDNEINPVLKQSNLLKDYPFKSIDWILEGGSFDTDGLGTLLTTSQCLLNPNREHPTDRASIENFLQKELGIKRILWLHSGQLLGDNTDSHVDMLARFLNPTTLAYAKTEDPKDPNFDSLNAMEQELKQFKQHNGTPYELVPIPLPNLTNNTSGDCLPATYLNFLITNKSLLVPQYQHAYDTVALNLLAPYFKDKKVIGIDTRALMQQAGGLHCASMQIPVLRAL